MPRDLPGFYFDAEKNRYFPIKGPIPGTTSRKSSPALEAPTSPSNPNSAKKKGGGNRLKPCKLLQARELNGNAITSSKGRCNFQEEYLKLQASQPEVWKYQLTRGVDVGLEHIHVNVQRPHGVIGTDSLLGGCMDGSLSVFEVAKVGVRVGFGVECMPECVWPLDTGKGDLPGHLWKRAFTSINRSSNISSVKTSKKHSNADGSTSQQHVIITTLGSEASGGSLYTLNLGETFDYNPSHDTLRRKLCEVTSFNCTVWNADCNSDGSQAVVGTNFGAALVNLETGIPSWVLRCKSDVLSVQLDHSGNNILCGLRNGAVVTVDARKKGFANRLSRHQVSYPSEGASKPSYRTARSSTNQWFELKGDIFHSQVIFMPSSVSCLASLQLYDQYFLASSMDGSIRLYDHRLIRRGPVQAYEGNANSHTRIQLGVDPSERILLSGGEDCKLRLWDIKSGELLYENKCMDFVPSAVCWPKGLVYDPNHSAGAWVGSQEGIYYVHVTC